MTTQPDHGARPDRIVRPEAAVDIDAVRKIHTLAFGQPQEARLVDALRAAPDLTPIVSLVAIRDDQIVGHVLFSPIRIGHSRAMSLAPLAVLPEFQRQGFGAALTRAGLAACARLGQPAVVVVGHPEYYPRFGFRPARTAGLEAPFEVSDAAFMVWESSPGALAGIRGKVEYPSPFDDL
ncbi:MAG TPA: N-acetyltransferase [Pirellulales bacterium]|jgi:putative acetyltransferase